jgi:hypothetical protein
MIPSVGALEVSGRLKWARNVGGLPFEGTVEDDHLAPGTL